MWHLPGLYSSKIRCDGGGGLTVGGDGIGVTGGGSNGGQGGGGEKLLVR